MTMPKSRAIDAVLFTILVVDVAIIVFSVGLLSRELRRRLLSPAVDPAPVMTAAKTAKPPEPQHRVRKAVARPVPEPFLALRLGREGHGEGCYGGACSVEPGEGEGCRIAYDVASPSSWSRYGSPVAGGDLSGFSRLEFQIRGETGDEVFKIVLGGSGDAPGVRACDLFPQRVPQEWEKVTIPLSRFAAGGVPVKSGDFALVFEHNLGMPYRGAVYLKDVRLVR